MSYCTDKLMIDGQTHAHTHTHTQATTIPEGQNWPRVITLHSLNYNCSNVIEAEKSSCWPHWMCLKLQPSISDDTCVAEHKVGRFDSYVLWCNWRVHLVNKWSQHQIQPSRIGLHTGLLQLWKIMADIFWNTERKVPFWNIRLGEQKYRQTDCVIITGDNEVRQCGSPNGSYCNKTGKALCVITFPCQCCAKQQLTNIEICVHVANVLYNNITGGINVKEICIK